MYEIFQQIMSGVSSSDPVAYYSYLAFTLVFVASFFRLLHALFGR